MFSLLLFQKVVYIIKPFVSGVFFQYLIYETSYLESIYFSHFINT